MDIDRMAKEWPDIKRRLAALEQGSAGRLQSEPQPTEVDWLIGRMEEATAALHLARDSLDAAMTKAPAAVERTLGSGNQSDELLRHEAKPLVESGL